MTDSVKCKYKGCDFKRSDEDAVKEHEKECEFRYVPCALCDAKIGLHSIADHVANTHHEGEKASFAGFSIPKKNLCIRPYAWGKKQITYKVLGDDHNPTFIFNFNAENEARPIVWISCIASKMSDAKRYEYSFKVKSPEKAAGRNTVYLFQGTRRCVPCDLSHNEVRKKGCYLVLDEETIEDAMKGEEGKIDVTMTIDKV